jgi:archaetidylserine synthase
MKKVLETIRLPDLISIANGALGYASCLMILEGYLKLSAIAILFASILDGIDGTVARNIEFSSFGKILDSFFDLISFGVAPALLVYKLSSSDLSIAISSAFVICGALRLARFTISSKENFSGLPITASGITVVLLFLSNLPINLILLLMIILSALMISDLKYLKVRDLRALFIFLILLLSIILTTLISAENFSKIFSLISLFLIFIYILSPFWRCLIERSRNSSF